jgi:hypothetical protein
MSVGPPVRGLCLALPDAESAASGDRHAAFSDRNRNFADVLVDHHGGGRVAATVKRPPGENASLVAGNPVRWFLPAHLGPRGWVGLDLEAAPVDWVQVVSLVTDSSRLVAPRALARRLDGP